jgi:hypothetical protein
MDKFKKTLCSGLCKLQLKLVVFILHAVTNKQILLVNIFSIPNDVGTQPTRLSLSLSPQY